jgi:hypothetical protein
MLGDKSPKYPLGWMGIKNNLDAFGRAKSLALPENQTTVSLISSP